MADDTDATTAALEPIAYLSRSEYRVKVLEALTETIPESGLDPPGYDPRDLRDVTGASEATVSRILNEFTERGWAERNAAGAYAATPVGQSIAIGFAPLLDSMAAIQQLGDAVALLPLDDLTIGLEHFRDATVRTPQGPQPADLGVFLGELLADSSTFHFLTYIPGPDELGDAVVDRITAGTLDSVQIWARDIIEFYLETDLETRREHSRAILEGGGEQYIYDGHIAGNIAIFDETVVFGNRRVDQFEDGTCIVTQNDVVREWALSVLERYKEAATALTVEDLPE